MVSRCVVPGCKNLGHHKIPRNNILRRRWLKAMKLEFMEHKYPGVCTQHFKDSDYSDSYSDPKYKKKRRLKKYAVPSIFPWNKALSAEVKNTLQQKMSYSLSKSDSVKMSHSLSKLDSVKMSHSVSKNVESNMVNVESKEFVHKPSDDDISIEKQSTKLLAELSPYLKIDHKKSLDCDASKVINKCTIQNDVHKEFIPQSYCFVTETVPGDVSIPVPLCEQSSEDHEENKKIYDMGNAVTFTKSCASCGQFPFYSVHYYKNEPNGIIFYTGLESFEKLMFVFYSFGNSVNNLNYFYGQPPSHLNPLEQFCMTLLILRRHREFEDIAMMYRISIKQVTNIFKTWIRFIAQQWRNCDLWIERDAISFYMLLDLCDNYPKTRVMIFDATKFPIKMSYLPSYQEITFSTYKNRNIKLLIGIAPSGLITYISPCYGDCFKIGNQIRLDALTRDGQIASKQVIGLLKSYKILTRTLNQTESSLLNDITFILAMLVNFRSLIKNNI